MEKDYLFNQANFDLLVSVAYYIYYKESYFLQLYINTNDCLITLFN